ncbi:hypothetical protein ENTCAN_07324 [Enterobacter cancerogenus ATCC 35316]|nr:hypothetical protein ENTCAN_07324 [Enterobacter cancerogenus ATCC 35316]
MFAVKPARKSKTPDVSQGFSFSLLVVSGTLHSVISSILKDYPHVPGSYS